MKCSIPLRGIARSSLSLGRSPPTIGSVECRTGSETKWRFSYSIQYSGLLHCWLALCQMQELGQVRCTFSWIAGARFAPNSLGSLFPPSSLLSLSLSLSLVCARPQLPVVANSVSSRYWYMAAERIACFCVLNYVSFMHYQDWVINRDIRIVRGRKISFLLGSFTVG